MIHVRIYIYLQNHVNQLPIHLLHKRLTFFGATKEKEDLLVHLPTAKTTKRIGDVNQKSQLYEQEEKSQKCQSRFCLDDDNKIFLLPDKKKRKERVQATVLPTI
ncbi:hypothetical protein U1Q18_009038 [Sarracenia purpurea var. burkii]